jgi:transcriptional regulator with XRE-family HTH domain
MPGKRGKVPESAVPAAEALRPVPPIQAAAVGAVPPNEVTYRLLMLGNVVRDARNARGFTQDKLAKLAGVSRRHLAALEKGANVSVLVVKKVAAALGLETIDLGGLSITTTDQPSRINVPLLTESLREARTSTARAERMLAQAERLAGTPSRPEAVGEHAVSVLPLPLPLLTTLTDLGISGSVRDRVSDWIELPLAAELEVGQALSELPPGEILHLPGMAVEQGEAIFRVRGAGLEMWGIADGDLLITELRPEGNAQTGELVIAIDEGVTRVGRWWNKRGAHRILSSPEDRATDAPESTPNVFGAINHVLRI